MKQMGLPMEGGKDAMEEKDDDTSIADVLLPTEEDFRKQMCSGEKHWGCILSRSEFNLVIEDGDILNHRGSVSQSSNPSKSPI